MAYIFLLVSLGLLFINLYLGCVISLVSLIISIIQFKKKDFLNIVTLILSSLVIVICIISFISSSFKKNVEISEETLDESKKNSYITYEQKLESLAKEYIIEDQMLNGMMYTGISYIQIDKLDNDNSNGCYFM